MYTVYLADDEQLIREGLAETIPWDSLGMNLIGTAEDGRQALKEIRELKPDVVLTDIRMPYLPWGIYICAVGYPAWRFGLCFKAH